MTKLIIVFTLALFTSACTVQDFILLPERDGEHNATQNPDPPAPAPEPEPPRKCPYD